MKRFVCRLMWFLSIPAALSVAWLSFVVATDRASYVRSLAAPDGVDVLVCGDSQTKDALDPAVFTRLFNFSNAASSPDQNLLRLKDVLARNPGRFKYVLVDASPLKLEYDPRKPVSETAASRVHFLIHLYHLGENIRPIGSYAALVRDVLFTRKFNEYRKALLRRKPWRSSLAGGFDPDKTRGFVEAKYREKAMADVAEKAARINMVPGIDATSRYFDVLAEEVAAVRAAGAVPVLTTMPLSRPLRQAVEPGRLAAFSKAAARVAALLGVEYLDYLMYDLPDECWHDANHLNRDGARAFTPVVERDFAALAARPGAPAPEAGEDAGANAAAGRRLVKAGEIVRRDMPADMSGLTGDGEGMYWAVCDSRGDICRFKVDVDVSSGAINGCSLVAVRKVPGGDDMEGLARDPLCGSFWISDENGPRVFEYLPGENRVGRELRVPPQLMAVAENRAFEAVEISPDGLSLWLCSENELPADATLSPGESELLRLTRFARDGADGDWRVSGQWLYRPEQASRFDTGELVRNGVAGICAMPDGSLFVLEREKDERDGLRFRARIFEVGFEGATDMLSGDGAGVTVPLAKRPVFDCDTGKSMYEGIALGPALADGSQCIVLVSDGDGKAAETVMTLVLR